MQIRSWLYAVAIFGILVACSPPPPTPTPTPIPCPSAEEQDYFDLLDRNSDKIFDMATKLGDLYGAASSDLRLLTNRSWQEETIKLEMERLALFKAYLDIPPPRSASTIHTLIKELTSLSEISINARIDSLRYPGDIDRVIYDERTRIRVGTALVNYERARKNWCK